MTLNAPPVARTYRSRTGRPSHAHRRRGSLRGMIARAGHRTRIRSSVPSTACRSGSLFMPAPRTPASDGPRSPPVHAGSRTAIETSAPRRSQMRSAAGLSRTFTIAPAIVHSDVAAKPPRATAVVARWGGTRWSAHKERVTTARGGGNGRSNPCPATRTSDPRAEPSAAPPRAATALFEKRRRALRDGCSRSTPRLYTLRKETGN